MKKIYGMSITAAVISMVILVSGPVFGHYVSVTADNYHPEPGEKITISLGWGHGFPGDGEMRRKAYEKTDLEMIGPDGEKTELDLVPKEKRGNHPVTIRVDKPGIHTIVLTQKKFSTKTANGYKYQPKDELRHVIHSKWSETVSKALIDVEGKGSKGAFAPGTTGERFQMIPLENPLEMNKGEVLPVKVTLDGEPWEGTVYATYKDFPGKADAFAYSTNTDEQGVAEIKILKKGLWLIIADCSFPYENPEKADEYSLKTSLTFKN